MLVLFYYKQFDKSTETFNFKTLSHVLLLIMSRTPKIYEELDSIVGYFKSVSMKTDIIFCIDVSIQWQSKIIYYEMP